MQKLHTQKKRKPSGQVKRDAKKQYRKAVQEEEAVSRNSDLEQVVVNGTYRVGAPPEKVVIHYGPTNSGKTYQSRERLLEKFEMGHFTKPAAAVYAAPLRMLAQENYEHIAARIGAENVGLLTGEESINPDAPVMCVTCEMTPSEGDFLIVDEAHWLADNDRGAVWTRVIGATSFKEVHIISAREAERLIEGLLEDVSDIEVIAHERFNELEFGGEIDLTMIPERTAIVAFSKKLVHMIAQRLVASGKNVSVLYGNLPPYSRREQIAKFISGETDYMVTTDVIGHGVNLPIENVVFVETTKFDGQKRRDLRTWEIAQIAGRAGRHDSAPGNAYLLTGIEGLVTDLRLIMRGVDVANGRAVSDLNTSTTYLAPTLGSLGDLEYTSEVAPRLTAWSTMTKREVAFSPIDLSQHRRKMESIERELQFKCGVFSKNGRDSGVQSERTIKELWRLVTLPVNFESEAFLPLATAILNEYPHTLHKMAANILNVSGQLPLDNLEKNVNLVRDLRMIHRAFPALEISTDLELAAAEAEYSWAIDKKIMSSIEATRYGVCAGCKRDCAPWISFCSNRCRLERQDRDS